MDVLPTGRNSFSTNNDVSLGCDSSPLTAQHQHSIIMMNEASRAHISVPA